MADNDNDTPRRLSLSESRVKEIVEHAILQLQLTLVSVYANKEDVRRASELASTVQDEAQRQIAALEGQLIDQGKLIRGLEQDKAGRDALADFRKRLTGGAILGTIFMAAQVVLTLWIVTHGGK